MLREIHSPRAAFVFLLGYAFVSRVFNLINRFWEILSVRVILFLILVLSNNPFQIRRLFLFLIFRSFKKMLHMMDLLPRRETLRRRASKIRKYLCKKLEPIHRHRYSAQIKESLKKDMLWAGSLIPLIVLDESIRGIIREIISLMSG